MDSQVDDTNRGTRTAVTDAPRAALADVRAPRAIRTDIQALRAVAVIAVILNHLWPGQVTGGYIGVDVFFVISGYLITSHLAREGDRSGKILLAAFWSRRAARLLPAAMLVLAVCLMVTLTVIPIGSRRENLVEIGAAAAYFLNWVLAANSLDYFAQGSAHTLVTHYWSLSVEEQFYLIWPVVLLLALVLVRRFGDRGRRVVLMILVAGVAVASLAWASYTVEAMPSAAYFQTTGRAWEFAAGGFVAMIPTLSVRWRARTQPLVWLGWVAIGAAIMLFDARSGVPGPSALLPVLATAVVILVGEAPHPLSTARLTSFRPVQIMGDLSYSSYLWHFPLIIGAGTVVGHLAGPTKAIIFILTIALAYMTKQFVEDPARRLLTSRVAPLAILGITVAAVAVFLGATAVATSDLDRRASAAEATLIRDATTPDMCFGAQAAVNAARCPTSHRLADQDSLLVKSTFGPRDIRTPITCRQDGTPAVPVRLCEFGAPAQSARQHVAVIGDSHAMMWLPALDAVAAHDAVRVTMVVRQGCPPVLDTTIRGNEPADYSGCAQWRGPAVQAIVGDPKIDVVLVAARVGLYRTATGDPIPQNLYAKAFAETWDRFLAGGKRLVVLASVPEFPSTVAECAGRSGDGSQCTVPLPAPRGRTILGAAAAQIGDERVVYMDENALMCDTVCHEVVGGIPAYGDSNHLSAFFVRSIGADFLAPVLKAAPGR